MCKKLVLVLLLIMLDYVNTSNKPATLLQEEPITINKRLTYSTKASFFYIGKKIEFFNNTQITVLLHDNSHSIMSYLSVTSYNCFLYFTTSEKKWRGY